MSFKINWKGVIFINFSQALASCFSQHKPSLALFPWQCKLCCVCMIRQCISFYLEIFSVLKTISLTKLVDSFLNTVSVLWECKLWGSGSELSLLAYSMFGQIATLPKYNWYTELLRLIKFPDGSSSGVMGPFSIFRTRDLHIWQFFGAKNRKELSHILGTSCN